MNNIDELLLISPEFEVIDKMKSQVKLVTELSLGDVIQWKLESYKAIGSTQLRFTLLKNGTVFKEHVPSNKLYNLLSLVKLENIATQDY